jgi:uncharacterized lipoprotein YddW (UPF0748 family)
MVASSTSFSDIQNHWARLFIEGLAQRGIVSGFPDKTFRPNQAVSRAEFTAILQKAFQQPLKRRFVPFVDVPKNHWAAAAIQKAYETNFLSGYPNNRFQPDEKITRVQVLAALVSGLGMPTPEVTPVLQAELAEVYQDAAQILSYAIDKVAAATNAAIVVNYPNIKLLNPNQMATRAEVVALIYQALVYQKRVPRIQSDYIVMRSQTITVGHAREFRGVWVTTVWNRNWPSRPALPIEQQKAELVQILDQVQDLKCNAIILQVRPEGDALYASQLEPWSAWLTGTQGKPPEPFYDPLEFAIAESHKRNIELHAWFNPYRAKTSTATPNVHPHIAVTYPECVYRYGNELWMDPGAQIVQDLTYNVILDVVRRYDVDGIHLDDYFYPYPIQGQPFPDAKTYATYQARGGSLSLADWRRENVNQMVQRLAAGIRTTKQHVKFGISPFGIYRPGQPAGIQGLDQYNQLYADPKKWLEQGWVDYLAPQLYWRIDPPQQSYPVLLKWWTENNPKQRHIYPGNNLTKLDAQSWPLSEVEKQVQITRSLTPQLSLGNIFFGLNAFSDNQLGICDTFKASIYAKPALVPTRQWLNTAPPAPPTGLRVKDSKLTWDMAPSVRAWTLYQQIGAQWTLVAVLAATTTVTTLKPGTYALCAVNRMTQESVGVVVSV